MDSIKKFLKNPLFHLSLVLILGLLLRLREFSSTSFWFDEGFTGNVIKFSWSEMFKVISEDEVHPPLYYILIRLWTYIFGVTQSGIRSFSVVTGLISVFVAYLIGKDFFSSRNKYPVSGLLLSFALAVSPFFVSYSVEGRSYSLICLEALLTVYFAFRYITKGYRWRDLLMLLVLCLLLFFTHYLQVVFIIALFISIIFYRYVFKIDSTNHVLLFSFLGIILLSLIGPFFFPIKSFLRDKGLQSLWWIPDISIGDTVRYNYSYLFGVVRYDYSVPDMRQMVFNISPYILASIIFIFHVLMFLFILKSKKIERESKRRATFLFLLWSICYFGFILLGVVGVNTLVERYTIACGVSMLLSFFLLLSLNFNPKILPYVVLPYIVLICMLKPLTPCPDWRIVPNILNGVGTVNRVVFKNPIDYVIGSFYLNYDDCYYIHWPTEKDEVWALPREDRGLLDEDLVKGDILLISPSQRYNYLKNGFEEIFKNSDFVILKKL